MPSAARADSLKAEDFIAWMEKLADTTVADQNDCSKMAHDVNKSVDDNKALIQAAQEAHAKGEKLSGDQLNRMIAAGKKMGQAIAAKCAQDKSVHAALARLPSQHH